MTLFSGLSASYPLNARTVSGHRLETDTIVDAQYKITYGGDTLIEKTLSGGGLTIDFSQALGDGYLFVNIADKELIAIGKFKQSLVITDCQGNRYGVNIRPEYIEVKE